MVASVADRADRPFADLIWPHLAQFVRAIGIDTMRLYLKERGMMVNSQIEDRVTLQSSQVKPTWQKIDDPVVYDLWVLRHRGGPDAVVDYLKTVRLEPRQPNRLTSHRQAVLGAAFDNVERLGFSRAELALRLLQPSTQSVAAD